MHKTTITLLFAGLLLVQSGFADPSDLRREEVFITIGGGDLSGVYFPAGLAIAKLLNAKRHLHGIRAAVEPTSGATFNLNAILAGYMHFGLTQSDKQHQALVGLAEWADKGPQGDLQAVFSLHHEAVTLVAAVDADISDVEDLQGKIVSTGNPGSSQHRIVMDVLRASNLDPKRDIQELDVTASEAPALLQDRRIDAYFFTVGHPSDSIRRALSEERKARIVPISGPAIDRLVADNAYYTHSTIPVHQLYPGVSQQAEVNTLGVIATLCTSKSVSADVVYTLTKEVLDNLEMFRRQHPALRNVRRAGMLEGLSAPLHPGALRYYKEIGMID